MSDHVGVGDRLVYRRITLVDHGRHKGEKNQESIDVERGKYSVKLKPDQVLMHFFMVLRG